MHKKTHLGIILKLLTKEGCKPATAVISHISMGNLVYQILDQNDHTYYVEDVKGHTSKSSAMDEVPPIEQPRQRPN